MNENEYIRLKVLGTARTSVDKQAFLVLLQEEGTDRHLPIVIGQAEAQAIATVVNDVDLPRPLTVDLLANLCRSCDLVAERVMIHTLDNGIFYADIHLLRADGTSFTLDARASDAIAFAIRMDAPIFTTEEIIDTVGFHGHVRAIKEQADEVSPLERLQAELEQCVELEEYERAAEIQKKIAQLTEQTNQNN